MKINKEHHIRIIKTLEALENVNNLIKLHTKEGNADEMHLAKQYERFKSQLTKELYELLAAYDIPIPVAVAA
jgi:two-component SAPR family response regulator